MLDIAIFDVGMGQCIYLYEHGGNHQPTSNIMIDCASGGDTKVTPINQIIKAGCIKYLSSGAPAIDMLGITNFDDDHVSDLDNILSTAVISCYRVAPNMTGQDINNSKQGSLTQGLAKLCEVVDSVNPILNPQVHAVNIPCSFDIQSFYLTPYDIHGLAWQYMNISTNDLSQIFFITYKGITTCISGDLSKGCWEILITKNPQVANLLLQTTILIAPHHGRDTDYDPILAQYCNPRLVVISDKDIIHDTQSEQTTNYGKLCQGCTVIRSDGKLSQRKVLTTRSNGNVCIQIQDNGNFTVKEEKD